MNDQRSINPAVAMGVGLLMGVTTINAAWPLTFRICDWHHGLFMIAFGFTVFGYGFGKWVAFKMARNYIEKASILSHKEKP